MDDARVMTKKQILAALNAAPKVYVWVRFTVHDGTYVKASKSDVRYRILNDLPFDVGEVAREFLAFTDEETGTLYIN